MRVLIILALTLLLVGWVPLVDAPTREMRCHPEVQVVARQAGRTVACFLVELAPLAVAAQVEAAVARAGGSWTGAWVQDVDHIADRAFVLGGRHLAISVIWLTESLTGLIVLDGGGP